MNAEEWLEKYGNVWPDEHSGTDAREFARRAECIIRALLAENERLEGAMNRAIKSICDCPEYDDGKSGECVRNPDFKSEICADHWREYLMAKREVE